MVLHLKGASDMHWCGKNRTHPGKRTGLTQGLQDTVSQTGSACPGRFFATTMNDPLPQTTTGYGRSPE